MESRIPRLINGGRVLLYTPLDGRHRATGACKHSVGGEPLGPVSALAICRHDGDPGYFLYYCDSEIRALTDTWHASFEDARHQAEMEFEGVRETWIEPTA